MQVVPIAVKRSRSQPRHSLRTLTYVSLDDANGGIVRNLNHKGLAVQTVAPLRPGQRVRVRFELRHPRFPSRHGERCPGRTLPGQSGIKFIDLPPKKIRQVNEWIFGDLLESLPRIRRRVLTAYSKFQAALYRVKVPTDCSYPPNRAPRLKWKTHSMRRRYPSKPRQN